MMLDDSLWIKTLFAASIRNCTPVAARQKVSVLFVPATNNPEASSHFASVLSDTELQQANSFLTDDLQAHFKQQRAFRRYCGALALGSARRLSQIAFELTDKGRPCLPELPKCCFSFASCRLGFLGAWSSTHNIGVDIEDPTRDIEAAELAQLYFSEAEAVAVKVLGERGCSQTFFRLWTLKEAALKSIEEGLPFGLDAFEFELSPTLRVARAPEEYGGPGGFSVHMIDSAGGPAALAVRRAG